MALLFIDSFDHYGTAELYSKWTGGLHGTIGTGTGRCGTNCLDMDRNKDVYRGIPFGSNTVTVGFAFCLQSVGTDPGRNFYFLYLNNSSGTGGWLATMVYYADGSLAVFVGQSDDLFVGQTPPNTIHTDVWYFIEWQVTFHASAGAMTIRINNVPLFTASGIDTVTAGRGGSPRQVYFVSPLFAGGQHYRVDDFYALDSTGVAPDNTFLGDSRVEYLRPRAAGSLQQWTPVGAASHWAAVDDNQTPDEDTTYVEATAANLTDTNLYRPTGLPSGPIFGAQLSLYARKTEIGPRVIAPVVNGVTGPSVGPSYETYQYYATPYALNPATGLAWTIAEINAIQAGVTVVT